MDILEDSQGNYYALMHTFEVHGVMVTNPIILLDSGDGETIEVSASTDDDETGYWTLEGLVTSDNLSELEFVAWLNSIYNTTRFDGSGFDGSSSQPYILEEISYE